MKNDIGKMVLSWKMALTSRLDTNSLKLNILDMIGFVSEYAKVLPSNLTSVGKHDLTNGSWKIWGKSISSIL